MWTASRSILPHNIASPGGGPFHREGAKQVSFIHYLKGLSALSQKSARLRSWSLHITILQTKHVPGTTDFGIQKAVPLNYGIAQVMPGTQEPE